MHPLAVEDLLHFRKNARSKADYYSKHLFLRVLCHRITSDDDSANEETSHRSMTDLPRSASPVPMDADEESASSWSENKHPDGEEHRESGVGSRFSTGTTLRNTMRRRFSNHHDVERQPMKSAHQSIRMSGMESGSTVRQPFTSALTEPQGFRYY